MTSRKIPKDYDNPLDNILIDLVEILNPYFKKLNFTPNGITFLSLVFGLITIVYFIKKRFIIAGMMFFISYLFDCMDGNYARKYDMQSEFGDKFDHYKDWSISGILMYLILFNKNTSVKFKTISALIIFISTLGMLLHTGCTEEYITLRRKNDKNNIAKNSTAINSVSFCPDIKYLKKSRYFGCATYNIIVIIIIISHKYLK